MKKKHLQCDSKDVLKNIFDGITYAVFQEEALFCMVNGMLTPRKPHLNSEIQNELKENMFLSTICKKGIYFSK